MLEVNNLIGFGVGGGDSHLYWRLNFPTPNASGDIMITEIEMRAYAGGPDQCVGGTPSQSACEPGYCANVAFDNVITDTSTYWTRDPTGWIQYQFSSPVDVKQISMVVYAYYINAGPPTIELQYSDTGSSFTTVGTWTGITWNVTSTTAQLFTV